MGVRFVSIEGTQRMVELRSGSSFASKSFSMPKMRPFLRVQRALAQAFQVMDTTLVVLALVAIRSCFRCSTNVGLLSHVSGGP